MSMWSTTRHKEKGIRARALETAGMLGIAEEAKMEEEQQAAAE